MGEGRAAVDHLVEDAAETPNITWLAQLHELWLIRDATAGIWFGV